MNREVPWFRVLVEGVVIVGSILLAFGIDAWWDGSQEQEEERQLLLSLQDDFTVTRDTLSNALDNHRQVLASVRKILDYGDQNGEADQPSIRDVRLTYFTRNSTFLKTGALDGALASGHLALITNGQLRSMLAEWPRIFGEFDEGQSLVTDLINGARPVIFAAASFVETFQAFDGATSPPVLRFLSSDLGRNYAAQRRFLEFIMIRDGQILLAEVDELLDVLSEEID